VLVGVARSRLGTYDLTNGVRKIESTVYDTIVGSTGWFTTRMYPAEGFCSGLPFQKDRKTWKTARLGCTCCIIAVFMQFWAGIMKELRILEFCPERIRRRVD
jgi:hypothetical protein